MMKNARFRLSADPTIGVADLMGPLEKYMTSKGDRNILTMVRPPSGVTQKTAPDLLWLNKNHTLYMEYAKVAPNSMIPPKKHRTALERLDCQTKCNFTKSTSEDWADQVDSAIRLALKQFRDLKKDVVAKERAFRRVDSVVQKNTQRVLDHLAKVDKESHFDDEDSQNPAEDKPSAKETLLAIMDEPDRTHKEPLEKKKTISPSKLFQRILEQEAETEDLETEKRTRRLPAVSSKEPHEEDRPALRKLQPFFSPVTIDAKEDMIQDAQNQGPIPDIRKKKVKKKKKDNEKSKQNEKAKPKGKPKAKPKGKPKGKAKAKAVAKEKKNMTQDEEAEFTKKEEAKVTKKPEEREEEDDSPTMKRPAKQTSRHTVQWENEPEPVVLEKWFDGMLDMVEEGRKKAKHRIEKTSGRDFRRSLPMKIIKTFQGEGSWPETFAKKNSIVDGQMETTNRMRMWNLWMFHDRFLKTI